MAFEVTIGTPLRPDPSVWLGIKLMRQCSRRYFDALAVTSVIEGLLPVAFIVLTGTFLGAAPAAIRAGSFDSAAGHHLLWLLVALGVVFVLQTAVTSFASAFRDGFRARFAAYRRERLMRATLAVPGIGHLEDAEYLDALRLASSRDWPDPGTFTTAVFVYASSRLSALVSAVIVGVRFSWPLAILLVAAWSIAGHELRKGQAEGFSEGRDELRRSDYFRGVAYDAAAAKEIRIFGLRPWVVDHFSKSWLGVMQHVWDGRRSRSLKRAGILVMLLAVNGLAFTVAAFQLSDGHMTVATLMVVGQAIFAISVLALMDENTMALSLGAGTFPAIIAIEERAKNNDTLRMNGHRSADNLPVNEIVFENVGFAYPGTERQIYSGLDLTIKAGTSLGIVGNNGAGKTTLIKLLSRMYDPQEGRILVDGVDLREFEPSSWQRRVAAIFQDFVHYEYSAQDNVGFGHIEKRDDIDALNRVAALVGADRIIEDLPNGWQTILTRSYEGGAELSGGQWQRIALARALFAVEGGAGVLVLDEPTANLDARAEVMLFDRFLEVTKGSTAVLISHRFSTVRRADKIVVIESGKVVEQGTHDELLAVDGRYAYAFNLQAGRYEDDDEAVTFEDIDLEEEKPEEVQQ
jgi:ABC-type multidrug transport system fused ATPase/permease subunit